VRALAGEHGVVVLPRGRWRSSSEDDQEDYGGFVERLDWHFDRLDALGINYRPLDP